MPEEVGNENAKQEQRACYADSRKEEISHFFQKRVVCLPD